ncbi:AI-2E family transporter [Salininema proteolyticum]|uniref:AI-2E family transporter n=1 Tax=Salininema proteolyticum TaxID=1607685 RepID=A0ABV8TYP7_9ACTN
MPDRPVLEQHWLARTPPLRAGFLAALGAAVVVVLWIGVGELASLITALIVAGFFATGLDQAVQVLTRRGLKRGAAVGIVIGVILLVACGALAAIIPTAVTQLAGLVEKAPDYFNTVIHSDLVRRFGTLSEILDKIQAGLSPGAIAGALGGILGGAASVATGLGWFLTTVLLSLFILAGYDRLKDGAMALIPGSKRREYGGYVDQILQQVGYYLIGAIIIALIAGTSAWIFMAVAGIPYAALLAMFVAVTDLIPNIGATIGAIGVVGVALSVSLWTAVAALIFVVLYQQIENWFIYPKVMGRAVQISNLAAIVWVLIGGALFGLVGIVLAVPAYAGIRLVFKQALQPKIDAA